jgi:hypothetical protein
MKPPTTASLISLILIVVFTARENATAQPQASAPNTAPKPVLVELFTSEGCSSCPPADALLQQLVAHQPVPGAEIIALEEHVDYWNHDGWVDPYSSPEWTQRQGDYAALNKNDPYTPEMVVDGQSHFLGSDWRKAATEIEKAAGEVQTEVGITPAPPDGKGALRFNVSVGKLASDTAGDSAEVWLAVTEDELQSSVKGGENSGRTLTHVATLRSLHKIGVADPKAAAAFAVTTPVKLNSHWNADNLHIAVFVQEKKSRRILGSASAKVKG